MASPAADAALPPAPQPIVRVMRLYKPGTHMIQTTPQLDGNLSICGFPLSSYILLPDSFGDIYYGEAFNAYIAVVNGLQNQAFHSVSLSIRLQTANSIIDLKDQRHADANSTGSDMKVLGTDDSLDAIVHHVL